MGERPDAESMFIGLDVHKATISIAIAVAQGERGPPPGDNSPPPGPHPEAGGEAGCHLYFYYEAGPCGYGLRPQLVELGHD